MKKYIKYIAALALLMVITVPASASAATVYLEASRSTIAVGDTAIIAVKINSDGAVLNTVDGNIGITSSPANAGKGIVQQFSLANSSFGLWPRTPSLSQDGATISYIGGVSGGFSIEGATLFKIIVQATSTGTVTFTPVNTSVFANDGNGTKVATQFKGLTLTVVPQKAGAAPVNDWSAIVSTDTTPPEPFIIVLGQDPSLSGGKKFAFFSAVDNQSGIDHYEVSEDGGAYVRTGSTYVLQDQSDAAKLTVVAYDKAGNTTSATYPASSGRPISWPSIIIAVILILIVYTICKKMVRKSKASKNVPTNL